MTDRPKGGAGSVERGRVTAAFDEHLQVARALADLADPIADVAQLIADALAAGGKLMLCGNGGSAADAQHLAAEFTGRFLRERQALPALALHANTSGLTAIGNDYGFERVFARQVEAFGRPGDVLVGITTSGNSANVLAAAEAARQRGMTVIGLTGAAGGKLQALSDRCLCMPSASTPRIQEMHILVGHVICELVEEALC